MKKNKPSKNDSLAIGGKKKEFPYELTIGMIVKNDVARLRTCLSTLQPLRDAISCQLIITDTGSTDGTRELAEEYADLLLDFTWCDDFSKARNTGVARAEGRWFAFFDSDHEFDSSILSVVEFLQSRESYLRDCASVNIRDFTGTKENLGYTMQCKPLLYNFSSKKRYFEARIHEYILADIDNMYSLPTVVKHWGYVGQLGNAKTDRNVPLLIKSIEEDPMELKNYLQIVGELAERPLEQKTYILKGIEVAKKLISKGKVHQLEEGILVNLQIQLAKVARKQKDFSLEEETLQKVEGKFSGTVLEQEYLGVRMSGYIAKKDVAGAMPYFLRMQRLYLALEKKPDVYYVNTGFFQCTDEEFYPMLESNLLVIAMETGKVSLIEEILPTCLGYRYANIQGVHSFLKKYLALGKYFKNAPFLLKMYEYILDSGNAQEQNMVEQLLEQCFLEYEGASYKALVESFSQEEPTHILAPYIFEGKDCSLEACPTVAAFFQDHPRLWTLHYKILLIDYLKTGKDRFSYIKKAPFSLLLQQFDLFWKQEQHPEQLMYDLFSATDFSSCTWKEKKLCGYLGLQALHHLCVAESTEISKMIGLYRGASAVLTAYNLAMYQEHILETQETDVIPKIELFAYHSHGAWRVEGDDVAYVTAMKSALLANRDYQKIVTFFLAAMQGKQQEKILVTEAPKEVAKEAAKEVIQKQAVPETTSELALKVKKTLGQLILAGKKEDAKMILAKYQKINPNDPDLPLLERTCEAI